MYRLNKARPVGQAVKTLASHAENMGSIPVRVTNTQKAGQKSCFFFFLCVGDPYFHRTQHLAQSATVQGFESQPRRLPRRPCKTRLIPVRSAQNRTHLRLYNTCKFEETKWRKGFAYLAFVGEVLR